MSEIFISNQSREKHLTGIRTNQNITEDTCNRHQARENKTFMLTVLTPVLKQQASTNTERSLAGQRRFLFFLLTWACDFKMLGEWRHVGIAPNWSFLHSHLNGVPLIENARDISRSFQFHSKENLPVFLPCILYRFSIPNFYGAFRWVGGGLYNQRRVHSDVKNLALCTVVVEGKRHSYGTTTPEFYSRFLFASEARRSSLWWSFVIFSGKTAQLLYCPTVGIWKEEE